MSKSSLDTTDTSAQLAESQSDLMQDLTAFTSKLDQKLSSGLKTLAGELKEQIQLERNELTQLIDAIKTDREENVLKLADIKDGIILISEKLQHCDESNANLEKSSAASHRLKKVDNAQREKVLEMIKKEEKNEFLSWELITRLYAHIFNASKEELIEISEQEQKERRRYIDNPKVWVDVFTAFSSKLESVSKNWEVKVLEDLGVPEKLFYKSAQRFLMERPQDIMLFNEQLMAKARVERAKNKESNVSLEQYRHILREQNDFIKNNSQSLLNLRQYLTYPNPGLFTNLVRVRIMDHLNEKFGIEEEDLALFLEQNQKICFSDPAIQELMTKADELLLTLGA